MSMPASEFVNITLSDSEGAVFKLTQFLKLRTVSDAQMQESHAQDPEQFHLAHVLLQKAYSSVWRYLDVEKVCHIGCMRDDLTACWSAFKQPPCHTTCSPHRLQSTVC